MNNITLSCVGLVLIMPYCRKRLQWTAAPYYSTVTSLRCSTIRSTVDNKLLKLRDATTSCDLWPVH